MRPVEGLVSEFLYKRWLRSHMDISSFLPLSRDGPASNVERADASKMTAAEFFQRFDSACRPVLLHEAINGWPGQLLMRERS